MYYVYKTDEGYSVVYKTWSSQINTEDFSTLSATKRYINYLHNARTKTWPNSFIRGDYKIFCVNKIQAEALAAIIEYYIDGPVSCSIGLGRGCVLFKDGSLVHDPHSVRPYLKFNCFKSILFSPNIKMMALEDKNGNFKTSVL